MTLQKFKIMVVGPFDSDKTKLVTAFKGEKVDKKYIATLGAAVHTVAHKVFEFRDLADQEKFYGLCSDYFHGTDCVLAVNRDGREPDIFVDLTERFSELHDLARTTLEILLQQVVNKKIVNLNLKIS